MLYLDLVQDLEVGVIAAGQETGEDAAALETSVAGAEAGLRSAAARGSRGRVAAHQGPNHAADLLFRKRTKVAQGKRVSQPANPGRRFRYCLCLHSCKLLNNSSAVLSYETLLKHKKIERSN